jgi:methionyl-tRNA formyltransferase
MLAGDHETGVCLMRLEAGLDTGPVFACARTPIAPDETAGELRARLVDVGTALLVDELPRVPERTPEPQQGEPTYAEKLVVDEFRLDPWRDGAEDLARIVRAGNPRPGAWFDVNGRRVKVWRAHAAADRLLAPGALDKEGRVGTVRGSLVLDQVQPEGKRTMAARAWLGGLRGDPHVDAP